MDLESGAAAGQGPQAGRRVPPVTQIRALLKKNMKIHVRTNALPCCPCHGSFVPCNACLLHVCCPIFFVFIVTAMPYMIIQSVSTEQEAKEFLEVTTQPGATVKLRPDFEVNKYNTMGEACGMFGHPVNPDREGDFRACGDVPIGLRPIVHSLFDPEEYELENRRGGNCDVGAYIMSCHCQTLALVGPDQAVEGFKDYLEQQYQAWVTMVSSADRSTFEDLVRTVNQELPRNMGVNVNMEGMFGRRLSQAKSQDVAPPQSARDRVLASLEPVAEFLDPTQRRLQEDDDDCPEVSACSVNPGHERPIFRHFKSTDDVRDWVTHPDYGRYSMDRSDSSAMDRLCGAVIFENNVLTDSKPAYTIRLNVTHRELDVSGYLTVRNTAPSDYAFDDFKWYSVSGFLALQHMVQGFLAEKRAPGTAGRELLQRSPHFVPSFTGSYREWPFGDLVGGVLGNPFTMSIMFGPIVASIAYYISRERATRQRELMRMMGLGDGALLWSWVIMFVVLNLLITFFMTILFMGFFFLNSDFFLLWMAIWWFSNAVVAFGMAVAAFVTSDRTAAMTAFALFFGLAFAVVSLNEYASTGLKVLISLIPPDAFLLTMGAFWEWELTGIGNSFSNSNTSIKNYSVGLGIFMMFFDFWLWLSVYYYFDNIVPWHDVGVPRKPWFCFTGTYWREIFGKAPVIPTSSTEAAEQDAEVTGYIEAEEDPHLAQLKANNQCVLIRNLHKSFKNASGQQIVAVNNLSLTMYQDECFCLLGHNGAGKTTTMMMLTGCMPQSSGTIKVKGCSIPEQIRAIRSSMGFCPQHNVLIDELTVMEHLELFGTIGGMTKESLVKRGKDLLSAVALMDKMNARSSALSGGMKRKLSCALAFLAEPFLVILDEPSSGMDPFARRGMWDTLKRWRTGHILCLTTHYMDEADALGDRIAIMSNGKLACSGSSTFLKKKFGCGYIIAFAKADEQGSKDKEILETVKSVVGPEVEIMSAVGKELLVQVPFAASQHFHALFPKIDGAKDSLGIESYGTSVTNLEEVFLKVAAMERERKKPASSQKVDEVTQPEEVKANKQASFALQVYALLIRRFKFGYRNRKTCACQIGLPVMCIFVFCLMLVLTAVPALPLLILDTSEWNTNVEGAKVPVTVAVSQGYSPMDEDMQTLWASAPGIDKVHFETISPAPYPSPQASQSSLIKGLAEEGAFARAMMENRGAEEASQYGGVCYPRTPSWCLTQHNFCPATAGVTVSPNLTAFHSAPIFFNTHAITVLKHSSAATSNPVEDIQVTNHPFPKTTQQKDREEFIGGIFAAIIIMAAYGFIPSGVTSYVVMEKERDVKNQLIISGCSYSAYWLSNLIFDVAWGLPPAIGAWITFAIYGVDAFTTYPGINASVGLFIMFLPAMASFAYCFSFLFSKSGIALFFSWVFNLSFGVLGTTLISVLFAFENTYDTMVFFRWLFRFVPIFSLGYGHLLISVNAEAAKEKGVGPLSGLGVGGAWCRPESEVRGRYVKDWACEFVAGDEFLMLTLTAFLWMAVTITVDVLFGLPAFKRIFSRVRSPPPCASIEDDMVLQEKQRVNEVDAAKQYVYVNNIHKVYNGRMHAVRGISFAAAEGQVFGLLGVNGAGKTTTFKMLCGQVEPTGGQVAIQGHDVTTQASAARKYIGYCPQFDALLDSLTTREHLFLYARLKGVERALLADTVDTQIASLDLNSYEQSRAGQLSGGNKRKLSVAMATIGEPPMVFLDEPSAGMDPVARRGMWSVVQNIASKRKKSVVILTTHSMEEAEALCSRIAIQVDGQFRCLGTAQQIKSKYGQGLELNVRLATPTSDDIQKACEKFGGEGTQVVPAADLKQKVVAAFDQGVCQELSVRPGSPLTAGSDTPLNVLAEWAMLAARTRDFETFLGQELGPEAPEGAQVAIALEKSQNVIRYQIMPAALQRKYKSLGMLFNLFEENKQRLLIEDFQVCQPSLEQIFNRFASNQASQASQAGSPAAGPAPGAKKVAPDDGMPAGAPQPQQASTTVKADTKGSSAPPPTTVGNTGAETE